MAETTHQRTALSDLVRTRRTELALSLRKLEERCVDPETGEHGLVKYSWLNKLEHGKPVLPPQLPELRALARGLDVPLRAIQDAAGIQFLGITPVPLGVTGDMRALLHHAEQLTPDELARLTVIAEALRKRLHGQDSDDQ